MLKLKKIISGGQTGADLGALIAAKKLNLETGGWAPRFFRTEDGSNIELGTKYGLQEHESREYPPRTKSNVQEGDLTLIFGNIYSPGCKLTTKYCKELNKPIHFISWPFQTYIDHTTMFIHYLKSIKPLILNCAGNRESKNPGIQLAIEQFLIQALTSQIDYTKLSKEHIARFPIIRSVLGKN